MMPVRVPAEALAYQMAIVSLYLDLPHTPLRVNPSDQQRVRRWFDRGIPLPVVETALMLGSLRRLMRPAEAPPLATIRSLAYFQPVIEELLEVPVPDSYRVYLQRKLQPYLRASAGTQPCQP
jgi:hypothetical protein